MTYKLISDILETELNSRIKVEMDSAQIYKAMGLYKNGGILKAQSGLKLDPSIFNPVPVYTSFQQADAALNETGNGQKVFFSASFEPVVISAKNTPNGYRSDINSIREDILNTSPKD